MVPLFHRFWVLGGFLDIAIYVVVAILPAALVGFLLLRLFSGRIATLQTWIQDAQSLHERLERDLASIEARLTEIERSEAVAELRQRLDKVHRYHKKGQEALSVRFDGLEEAVNETRAQQKAQAEAVQVVKTVGAKEAVAEVAGGLFASPVFKDVVAMLNEGVEPADIARKTGLQVGEIGLIRGLKGFSGKSGA